MVFLPTSKIFCLRKGPPPSFSLWLDPCFVASQMKNDNCALKKLFKFFFLFVCLFAGGQSKKNHKAQTGRCKLVSHKWKKRVEAQFLYIS